MANPSTHFKLGLLVIAATAAVLVVAFGFGVRTTHKATVTYHTYFDESVQGLDVGAPVKYRGVRIGNVKGIAIAPDRRRVDASLSLDGQAVHRLGLATAGPQLRAQLRTLGITGVKIVDIDFVDPAATPAPELSFPPADHYIPSRPSLFKDLEDNAKAVAQRLPEAADHATATLSKLDSLIDELRDQHLVQRVGRVADQMSDAVLAFQRLEHRTAPAIDKLTSVLDRLDGDRGLVASARRATDSISEVGRNAVGATNDLEQTIHDLGDAARSVREFLETLERDPDMLVKGRGGHHR